MGPLGWPETVFIFVLALLLFGPKKLPELGRTVAKALTEFRRASAELKSTFDRELKNLERETEGIREVTNSLYQDTYTYDYPAYDHAVNSPETSLLPAPTPDTTSASAPQGAHSTAAVSIPTGPPEGAIANGSVPAYGTESSNGAHHAFAPPEPHAADTSAEPTTTKS